MAPLATTRRLPRFFGDSAALCLFDLRGAVGLSNLNVTSFLKDHTGLIWVGTQNGIFLADGLRFQKQKDFADAGLMFIRVLREDGARRRWAMGSQHLVYCEHGAVHEIAGLELKFLNDEQADLFILPPEPDSIYLLRSGALQRITSDDHGHTWRVSDALPPRMLWKHPELQTLTTGVSGGRSIVWAGCENALCRVDLLQSTMKRFGEREGVMADEWKRTFLTRSGTLWARGKKHVVGLGPGALKFTEAGDLPAMCI